MWRKYLSATIASLLLILTFTGCTKFDGSDSPLIVAVDANSAAAVLNAFGVSSNTSNSGSYSNNTSSVVATTAFTAENEAKNATEPQSVSDTNETKSAVDDTTIADTENKAENPTENSSDSENTSGIAGFETKEKIVDYYKECFNLVKSSAKGITHTISDTSNSPAICEAGKLSSIASTLMNTFLKESEPNEEMAVSEFPPSVSAVSALDSSFVDTATITESGDYYEVYIKLDATEDNPDVNPESGGGKAGTLVNIIEASQVEEAAGSMVKFENLKNSYFETSVKAKIEKSTKHIVEAEFICPSIMSFDKVTAAIISVENARLGLTYRDVFTVQW